MLCGVALPSGAVCRLIGQPHHMQAKALDRIGVSANINMSNILRTCHDPKEFAVPCIPILCDLTTLGEYIRPRQFNKKISQI